VARLRSEFVDNDVSATSREPRPQFDHMMALVDAGEVDPPKWSHLEIDRRVVHNLCISRAIAACSRTLSRRGG
jgi:site-specific DNA recombinase